MSQPKALVLHGDGINCEDETCFALGLAGFVPSKMHVAQVEAGSQVIRQADLIVLPGGFSFGDEIASGKVLALKLEQSLQEELSKFIAGGKLVLGICNGFQVLVQMGLLPGSLSNKSNSGLEKSEKVLSLVHNKGGQFINRWVELEVSDSSHCPFLSGLKKIELPIRHGEGRILLSEPDNADLASEIKKLGVLRYGQDINGSFNNIAGLCNKRGNVFGLMPHPEAFVRWTQHPAWLQWRARSQNKSFSEAQKINRGQGKNEECPDGLTILKNAHSAFVYGK